MSGVLAAVVSGLYCGWHAPSAFDAETRLAGTAFWRVLTFGLEAMLFVLLGLQAPVLAEELEIAPLAAQAVVVALVVVGVRMAWALLPPGGRGRHGARADGRGLVRDARRDLARRGAGGHRHAWTSARRSCSSRSA